MRWHNVKVSHHHALMKSKLEEKIEKSYKILRLLKIKSSDTKFLNKCLNLDQTF